MTFVCLIAFDSLFFFGIDCFFCVLYQKGELAQALCGLLR